MDEEGRVLHRWQADPELRDCELSDQDVDDVVDSGGERESSELQLVVDHTGCWSFTETELGRGPRPSIVVGDADRIDYGDLSSHGSTGGMNGVWRCRPAIQGRPPEGRKGS